MADMVLFFCTHFSKCLFVAVWLEYGVVAEALATTPLWNDRTVDDTFKFVNYSILY